VVQQETKNQVVLSTLTMHVLRFFFVGSVSLSLWHVSSGFSVIILSSNSLLFEKLSKTNLSSSYGKDDGNGNSGGSSFASSPYQEWWKDPRINVLNLLTQRAIQSFMFLCESVRDPHSGKWIEDFLQTENQLEYHGTGARYCCTTQPFGGTWDGPLLAMMEQPKDVIVVRAKRRGRCVSEEAMGKRDVWQNSFSARCLVPTTLILFLIIPQRTWWME
jgi:hypothetical protein